LEKKDAKRGAPPASGGGATAGAPAARAAATGKADTRAAEPAARAAARAAAPPRRPAQEGPSDSIEDERDWAKEALPSPPPRAEEEDDDDEAAAEGWEDAEETLSADSAGPSAAHDRGLFASRALPARRCVGQFHGERIDAAEFERRRAARQPCLLRFSGPDGEDVFLDGGGRGRLARMNAGAGAAANVEFVRDGVRLRAVTRRPIRAGEELLADFELVGARARGAAGSATPERAPPPPPPPGGRSGGGREPVLRDAAGAPVFSAEQKAAAVAAAARARAAVQQQQRKAAEAAAPPPEPAPAARAPKPKPARAPAEEAAAERRRRAAADAVAEEEAAARTAAEAAARMPPPAPRAPPQPRAPAAAPYSAPPARAPPPPPPPPRSAPPPPRREAPESAPRPAAAARRSWVRDFGTNTEESMFDRTPGRARGRGAPQALLDAVASVVEAFIEPMQRCTGEMEGEMRRLHEDLQGAAGAATTGGGRKRPRAFSAAGGARVLEFAARELAWDEDEEGEGEEAAAKQRRAG